MRGAISSSGLTSEPHLAPDNLPEYLPSRDLNFAKVTKMPGAVVRWKTGDPRTEDRVDC